MSGISGRTGAAGPRVGTFLPSTNHLSWSFLCFFLALKISAYRSFLLPKHNRLNTSVDSEFVWAGEFDTVGSTRWVRHSSCRRTPRWGRQRGGPAYPPTPEPRVQPPHTSAVLPPALSPPRRPKFTEGSTTIEDYFSLTPASESM